MAVELIQYDNVRAVGGNSQSTLVYVCDWWEREDVRASLLRQLDPYDLSLMVHKVGIKKLRDDSAADKAELRCEAIPSWRVLRLLPDLPFFIEFEDADEAITVEGAFHWASDDAPLNNKKVLPVQRFTVVKAVLSGTLSQFAISTYGPLVDHVNLDVWEGAEPETLLFRPWRAKQRQDDEGQIVWDVQLNLLWRFWGWNLHFREDTGQLDRLLHDGTNDPLYPSTTFGGTLPAVQG